MSKSVVIRIEELVRTEKLDAGMVNVTGGSAGYRFLPAGMKFAKAVTLRLPYDRSKVGTASEFENLYTYYYNEEMGKWEKLYRVEVDERAGVTVSLTNHFTDMVNSTLKLPESPKTLNFNPTSVKDVKGGDPGNGIQLIKAPEANQEGSAVLRYEIEVPGGRRGMQPKLEVTYSSEGGNGWLGLGWNLAVSSVRVETRWGVPRYDGGRDTETYLLDGQMLTPTAHRGAYEMRTTGDKRFYPRVEGSFALIVRHGDRPSGYWWEVTDKGGRKRFYGGTPEDGLIPAAVVGNNAGICQWNLVEERDVHGNYVRYAYERVSDIGTEGRTGSTDGVQSYAKEVSWTGNRGEGLEPAFKVVLKRDRDVSKWPEARRHDAIIDCRGGMKVVTADLLKRVEVYEGTRLIRAYGFEYAPGSFGKSLLASLVQYGSDGSEFYRQRFSYYDEVRNGSVYDGFSGTAAAVVPDDGLTGISIYPLPTLNPRKTVLGMSEGRNVGLNGYVGLNWEMGFTKNNSAGIRLGYNWSGSDAQTVLMDMDGDGIVDKAFIKSGKVYYRPGVVLSDGTFGFAGGEPIEVNIDKLSVDVSNSIIIGAEAYPVNGYISAACTYTWTEGTTYWTDANGDGLPDLVKEGVVWFCHLEESAWGKKKVVFSTSSADTEAPVTAGGAAQASDKLQELLDDQYDKKVEASPPVDAVRVWTAPYTGKVRITGTVALDGDVRYASNDGSEPITRESYGKADGVRVSIQKNDRIIWPAGGAPLDIEANDARAHDTGEMGEIEVAKGDRIYFRVNSKYDGLFDVVRWTPVIQYTKLAGVTVEEAVGVKDANGLDAARYAAGEDFTAAGRRMVLYPGGNTDVNVSGVFHKGPTTDDVTVKIVKIHTGNAGGNTEECLLTRTYSWNESVDVDFADELGQIPLEAADGIEFRIEYDSPIDLERIRWAPELSYSYYYDAGHEKIQLLDKDKNPYTQRLTAYCSAPIYRPAGDGVRVFNASDKNPWVEEPTVQHPVADGTMHLWPKVTVPAATDGTTTMFAGRVVFTVKSAATHELMGKTTFALDGTTAAGQEVENPITIEGVERDGKYYFEFHFDDENVRALAVCGLRYRYGSDPEKIKIGENPDGSPRYEDYFRTTGEINVFERERENLLPGKYRGWGAFGYNACVTEGGEDRGALAIKESELVIDKDYVGTGNIDPTSGVNPGNAHEPNAYIMYPDPSADAWKSPAPECWEKVVRGEGGGDELVMSSSRKGDTHPERMTLSGGAGGGLGMMKRLSKSERFGAGVSAGNNDVSVGANSSGGYSNSIVDYLDFNGDRLPDFLNEGSIQYSAPTGGMSDDVGAVQGNRMNNSMSAGVNAGPNIPIDTPDSRAKNVVYLNSMAPGGSLGVGQNDCWRDFIDMNGDGLPDLVVRNPQENVLSVGLNNGYGFESLVQWGAGMINYSVNLEGGTNIDFGFNIDYFSFGGGLSGGNTVTGSTSMLIDMNGDGLPDYVTKGGLDGALVVSYNTGNGFGETVQWHGGFFLSGLTQSYTMNQGACAYATVGIPIPIIGCSIIINVGGSTGVNANWQTAALRDLNSDGCPDYVLTESDNGLLVRYNLKPAFHSSINIICSLRIHILQRIIPRIVIHHQIYRIEHPPHPRQAVRAIARLGQILLHGRIARHPPARPRVQVARAEVVEPRLVVQLLARKQVIDAVETVAALFHPALAVWGVLQMFVLGALYVRDPIR